MAHNLLKVLNKEPRGTGKSILVSRSPYKKIWLLFVILIGLIGCSEEPAEKPYGGTLRLGGLGGRPSIINPVLTDRTVSKALLQLIFNSLVRLNKEMLPEPDLAEAWDISEDGLVYTFHLRRGVRFHDGVECTAEDVKFTYELITDPAVGSPWQSYFEAVEKWEATDKYTFKIMLKEPFAPLISMLTEHIAPRHLLKEKDLQIAPFNRHPIGTGPFRFREWTGDNKIILEANPDYYEGRPYLDRIIASGYEDTSKYWGGFMRGEIDAIFFLSKEDLETTKRDPDFRTYAFPYIWTYGIEYNPEHPFLKEQKVRQAITHSINLQDIINKVESDYGMPSTGPFLPGSWSCNPEVKPLEYDPTLALRLLKEAGWELNKDNILEKDGQEFRFTMLVNTALRDARMMAMLIYQDLYRLGIRIDIRPFEYKKRGEGQYKDLAQEAGAYLTFFGIMADPADLALDWYSSHQAKIEKLWSYQNLKVDRLFDLGLVTTEIERRQKIYWQIHKTIFEDQPVTFLYFFYHLGAINSRFQDTDSLFSPAMPFYTIKDWHIKKAASRQ